MDDEPTYTIETYSIDWSAPVQQITTPIYSDVLSVRVCGDHLCISCLYASTETTRKRTVEILRQGMNYQLPKGVFINTVEIAGHVLHVFCD